MENELSDMAKNMRIAEQPQTRTAGEIRLPERTGGIPDLVKLTGMIIEFVEYIETPEMKTFAQQNKMMFRNHLEEKFDEFTLEFYSIYKMLVDDEAHRSNNLDRLFNMIRRLQNMEKNNSNVDKEFVKVQEQLAEEYLYPQFGGKNEFYKKFQKK